MRTTTLNPLHYKNMKRTERILQSIKQMNLYKFVALNVFKHDAFDAR